MFLEHIGRATAAPERPLRSKLLRVLPAGATYDYEWLQEFNPPIGLAIDYPSGNSAGVSATAVGILSEAPGSGEMQPFAITSKQSTKMFGDVVNGESMVLLDPRGVIRHSVTREVVYEPRQWSQHVPPWVRKWLADHPDWPATLWQPPKANGVYGNHLDALDALLYHRSRMESEAGRQWAGDTTGAIAQLGVRLADQAKRPAVEFEHATAVRMLQSAVPYYWTSDLTQLVTRSATALPDDVTLQPSDLVSPAGFAWLQQPIQWPRLQPGASGCQWISGWSWLAEADMLTWIPWLYEYQEARWGTLPGVMAGWQWGESIGEYLAVMEEGFRELLGTDIGRVQRYLGYQRDFLSLLAASTLFVQQRVVVHARQEAPRHFRKQAARSYAMEYDPGVQVVQLRRPKHTASAQPGEGREWSCQWAVDGHWHKYWYASEQRHKHLWVASYVKGPEGKPLKQKAVRLYKVER